MFNNDYIMAKKNRRTPQENYAIMRKIEELQAEGLDRDRATAAAFRMWREDELDIDVVPKLERPQQETRRALRLQRVAAVKTIELGAIQAARNFLRLLKGDKRTK